MIRYGVVIWEVPTDVQPTHVRNGVFSMHLTTITLIVTGLFVIIYFLSRIQPAFGMQAPASTESTVARPVDVALDSSMNNGALSTMLQHHLARAYIERQQADGARLNAPGMRVLVELGGCTPHELGVEYTLHATAIQTIHSENLAINTDPEDLPPYKIILLKD